MAWVFTIDPTVPTDVDPAAQGDDQIRNLKSAMDERFVTLIAGWPSADPLYNVGAIVSTAANRPAAPALDGVLHIASDTGQVSYSLASAWVDLTTLKAAPDYSGVPTPTNLQWTNVSTCSGGTTPDYKINVQWSNGAVSATLRTRVYLDGIQIHDADPGVVATLSEDVNSFGAGDHVLEVRHYDSASGLYGTSVTKNIYIPNPCASALAPLAYFEVTDGSTCDAGPTSNYKTTISFTRSDPAASVRILRDGVVVVVLAPGITGPYTDNGPSSAATYNYQAFQEKGGGAERSAAVSDSITLVDPCGAGVPVPNVLRVEEDGYCGPPSVNEAKLTWGEGQGSITFDTRIYKRSASTLAGLSGASYSMLAQVGSGVREYTDNVIQEDPALFYEYYVTFYDTGGPTEGSASNTVVYLPGDLC